MSRVTTFVIGALAGALAGVCAGIMLAPRAGYNTGFVMARKVGSLAGDFENFASDIPGSVKNIAKGARGAKSESADADELRAKIEAARARIAAEAAKENA